MCKFKNSEGLYRKVESPIKESVSQCEGLYKKQQSVIIHNPTNEEIDKAKNETTEVSGKKVLKG